MTKKRVVVGLSGGVDSSVAALLLLEQGYEVIGVFMKNWHDDSVTISDECPWLEDHNDALMVAERLGIPFQTLDLSVIYKARIVEYMFDEYQQGRTPNPDVLCNREIKFDVFLKAALELGADYVATGHYCQKTVTTHQGKEIYHLRAGADNNKDQSYFLCQVSQEQLAYALFPIGHLKKAEVREIAEKNDLITADKRDSQGLCFIGKVKLPDFLQQKLAKKTGDVVEVLSDHAMYSEDRVSPFHPYIYNRDTGEQIGQHQGAHFYTIGQRKGLDIGGKANPLFIIHTDTKENLIFVGMGTDHPGLYRTGLFIKNEETHWIREDERMHINTNRNFLVRIRYRQELQEANISCKEEGLYIEFKQPQRGITPGQFAAWYDGDELIGSGVINA